MARWDHKVGCLAWWDLEVGCLAGWDLEVWGLAIVGCHQGSKEKGI